MVELAEVEIVGLSDLAVDMEGVFGVRVAELFFFWSLVSRTVSEVV